MCLAELFLCLAELSKCARLPSAWPMPLPVSGSDTADLCQTVLCQGSRAFLTGFRTHCVRKGWRMWLSFSRFPI